jgi:hypothetical protein
VTISAEKVETVVVARVRDVLAHAEGRASVEANALEAERELEQAQAALEGAIRAFSGLEDEQATRTGSPSSGRRRDMAAERVEHLGSQRAVVVVSAAADWDRLTLDERRALIRATVSAVRVVPGRGAGVSASSWSASSRRAAPSRMRHLALGVGGQGQSRRLLLGHPPDARQNRSKPQKIPTGMTQRMSQLVHKAVSDQEREQVQLAEVVLPVLAPGQRHDAQRIVTAPQPSREDVRGFAAVLAADDRHRPPDLRPLPC